MVKFHDPKKHILKDNTYYLWKDKQKQYYIGKYFNNSNSITIMLGYCYGISYTIDMEDMVGVADIDLE